MGYRVSTIMMQLAGYSNSIERIGARWVGSGLRSFVRDPAAAYNFVMEKSGEVRDRMSTMDRDIQDNIRQLAGKIDPLEAVKKYAFHGIGWMDRVVCIPSWLGAYNKATEEGMSEEDAIYAADKAVRQAQGAGAAKDLARVQRGTGKAGEAMKLTTMFYSYMSAFYQRQRQLGRDTGEAIRERNLRDFPSLLARAFWLYFIPSALSELLAGRGPDDDEDWGMWAMQKMLLSALGPLPVIRDIAGGVASGFGYEFTPASGLGRTAVNVWKDASHIVQGEDTKRATRNALELAGYATGKVTGQVAAATQFLVDVGYGDQDPQNVGDWWEGLTKGKVKEE
jgi:hypothetical protein